MGESDTKHTILSSPSPAEAPAAPATKPKRTKRQKPTPPPDVVPAPGTLARKVYDAIVSDRVLGPIVAGPGDASERWADPATFPGVDVLAEVRRAGEYAATRPGQYSDGRAFLRKWLQSCADRRAAAPKPAASTATSVPAARTEQAVGYVPKTMRIEQKPFTAREKAALLGLPYVESDS